mmetsp:Transcript_311/g.736  ORF Transcript_311/g.736 Transcript_311/m.736 type:complete len:93 (-) Transcript_311:1941-2219(-)|eukprot:CAMPEP_0171486638 /NCGR_PEP_ID=MMETSP0958-20121227/1200_1 /TAXON_ID=87120 /ORGANISM="Aurantiochytrium limacinum, Strain ATCCMYA-1381" /LENGTH=92 /DNA_ID=CAMNT_0012019537 /DNA_START=72 /DNA_END=350 /DNA_ORIENTATION=+
MEAAAGLPEHLHGEFLQAIEEMQIKGFLEMHNKVTQSCFKDCVKTFHSKNLTGEENKCINTCTAKFLVMSQRLSQRYAEVSMEQQMEMQGQQ